MKTLYNKTVAICTSQISEETTVQEIIEFCKVAKEYGIKVAIFGTPSHQVTNPEAYAQECKIFEVFNAKQFDALVMFSEKIADEDVIAKLMKKSKDANIPVVSIDRVVDGAINIIMDYATSFEILVRHVIEYHKVKDVCFIGGFKDNDYSLERENIFRKVMSENNLPVDEDKIGYGQFWEGPVQEVVEKFIEGGKKPEAIICANDVMAIRAIEVLEEHGYSVPEDIIVTGFDGLARAKWNIPEITTCQIDYNAVSRTSFQAIVDAFSGEEYKERYMVNYEFLNSQSCGCKEKTYAVQPAEILNLYELNRRIGQYQRIMFEFPTQINGKDSIIQVANVVHSFLFNDGFVIVDNSIKEFNFGSSDNLVNNPDDPQMRVVVRRRGLDIEMGQVFNRSRILPGFKIMLSSERPIVFAPLNRASGNYGYLAINADLDQFFFSRLVMLEFTIASGLENFINQRTLKLINHKMEENNARLAELYVHDPLTRLLNRRGFYNQVDELMKRAIENDWGMFVISIDLDDLKVINDTYGHAEGDNAIKTVANAMMINCHDNEICARFGGDEFAAIGIARDAAESGDDYMKHVTQYLVNYNRDSDKPYEVKASYGMSINKPDSESFIDEFMLKADRIMYENKKSNKKFKTRVRAGRSNLVLTPEERKDLEEDE